MTATLLDGRAIATQRKIALKGKIEARCREGHRAPGIAVVIVGEDPASKIYVEHKRKACKDVGITSYYHPLPADVTEATLLKLIDELNQDPLVDGILCQLPLPPQIATPRILDAIQPNKDVDGFHPYTMGCLLQRRPLLRPCTPYGIINLLKSYAIDVEGLDAAVIGASNIVGRPMALELLQAGATVTICHRMTKDIHFYTKNADIVVVAVGNPQFLKASSIKEGAIVVDVGINRLPDGKVVGDVDFEGMLQKAAYITPVPGGVGPMTVITLMENTYEAACF